MNEVWLWLVYYVFFPMLAVSLGWALGGCLVAWRSRRRPPDERVK